MKGNITKKKAHSPMAGLKAMTNWILGKQRKKEELKNIIQTFQIDNNILKRFLLYTYNTPYITWYINKHLNHLYNFNKYDIIDLMYSLTYLLDINRINKKSIPESLLYLKSTELADKNKSKIKQLLKEYFEKIFDREFNESELNFYYDLINLNFVTFDDINKIDEHINGKTTIKPQDNNIVSTPQQINHFILDIYRKFPPGIQTFCNEAKNYILSRAECKSCELFGKPSVILDTNMEDGGEVDVMFFGLNPGIEEVEINKPFVGKAGKTLRESMSHIPGHIKWVITNIILCHTRNESEIKNPEDVKKRCRKLVEGIKQTFPAKVIVPLGAKAIDWFGLKGGISSLSGRKFITNNNQQIIPIIHPSAANYNPESLNKFKKDFETVLQCLNSLQVNTPITNVTKIKHEEQIKVSGDKFITNVTPDLTFFDVREVSSKIIMIYINPTGQKKYLITDYNMHFYLKNDVWKNCDQITDRIDGIVNINNYEKNLTMKIVREKLNSIKSNKGE